MSEKQKPPKRPNNQIHHHDVLLDFDGVIVIPAAVMGRYQQLSVGARNTYLALARIGATHGYVPIIATRLAAEAGVHRSTARRALTRLGDLGLAKQRIDHGQERWRLVQSPEGTGA